MTGLNFIQSLIEIFKFFWPFRIVNEWERGALYVAGRWFGRWPARRSDGTVGPGLYFVVPFLMELHTAIVVPWVQSTPLMTITTRDGQLLMFSATATFVCFDTAKAINRIESVTSTAIELVMAVTAEKLAEVKETRLDGDSRKRLVSDITRWTNEEFEALDIGVRVDALRFTNFGHVKTYRLLTDAALQL